MRCFGWIGCLLLILLVVGPPGGARGAGSAPVGPSETLIPDGPPTSQGKESAVYGVSGGYNFRTYCASCHGVDGKGEGPLAESLRFRPPDLSLLAKRSGGDYPAEKIQRIIDGRKPLKGHGGPDMPIWGDAFKNPETGYDEKNVNEKIRSVVDFLRTLQSK